MRSSLFTTPGACPLPPAPAGNRRTGLARYVTRFLRFFFRFGVCPLCITASVGYGTYRLLARLLSSPQTTPSHATRKP